MFRTFAPGQLGVTVATFGPYTLVASCTAGADVDNVQVVTQTRDVAMTGQGNGVGTGPVFDEDQGGAPPNEIDVSAANVRGQATFSVTQTNGTTYSGNIGFDDPNILDGQNLCAVYGHIIVEG